jgi:hypothetical protein
MFAIGTCSPGVWMSPPRLTSTVEPSGSMLRCANFQAITRATPSSAAADGAELSNVPSTDTPTEPVLKPAT